MQQFIFLQPLNVVPLSEMYRSHLNFYVKHDLKVPKKIGYQLELVKSFGEHRLILSSQECRLILRHKTLTVHCRTDRTTL